ncbi:Proline-rich protein 11, partial [Eurypyga helias]
VKPFTTTASLLYCWCQHTVAQSFRVVKDTIFPSQIYLKELNTLKEQLEKLETEFSRLQGILQINGMAALSSENSFCQRCNKAALGAPAQMQMGPLSSGSGPSTTQLQPVSAPPPPPPPPPLPKLPPAPLPFKRVNGSKALLGPSLKKDGPMQITLKDLLNVKLKKTDSGEHVDKQMMAESPVKTRRALITVSDLQGLSLRPKSKPSVRVTNPLFTPPKNLLDLRKHLKKVNVQRSPGGTPLNSKENIECGSGLTPIMTQALRRKFQMAHPKSPSPAGVSAASSFDE